tara:strand:- start:1360 stop:1941 length:582 start_codon:yes stop_codon:yes gene_type:complete
MNNIITLLWNYFLVFIKYINSIYVYKVVCLYYKTIPKLRYYLFNNTLTFCKNDGSIIKISNNKIPDYDYIVSINYYLTTQTTEINKTINIKLFITPKIDLCNFNFILVTINVNNFSYNITNIIKNNYNTFYINNASLFTVSFNNYIINNYINEDISDYTINIIDQNADNIVLTSDQYIILSKNNYKIINNIKI